MTRQWSTTPEMLGGRAEVVARDALGNPIANAGVSVFIDSGGGALLTSDEFNNHVLDQGGMILLSDITDPPVAIQDQTTVSNGEVTAYVVLGPPDEGAVEISFFVTQGNVVVSDKTTLDKATPVNGTILYAWSGRPTGSAGQFIEAYHPGSEISRPMVLDLFRVEPDDHGQVHPVRAPEDELRPVFAPVGCPAGTALVDAPAPQIALQTGEWATGLKLGATFGRCQLTAMIEEWADGSWQDVLVTNPSAPVWAVEMTVQTPLPDVILAIDDTPAREGDFSYGIQPTDYVPQNVAVVFEDQGRETGVAQAVGRGLGHLTLPAGMATFTRGKPAGVHLEVNRGVVWGVGTDHPVSLRQGSQSYPLNLIEIEMNIVPDWNRDRVIDADDEDHVTDERPLRWWINDDNDEGDITGMALDFDDERRDRDFPGRAGDLVNSADCSNTRVDGRSDLEDFFPLWLDLQQALSLLPVDEGFEYRLRQEDRAVKFAYIDVAKEQAGIYLTDELNTCGSDLSTDAFEADTIKVDNAGVALMPSFLDLIMENPDEGIVMVEGAADSESPLYLEVIKDARVIERAELPLSISTVEAMYRWICLRYIHSGWESEDRHTDTSEPSNFPDSESDGNQIIAVHGYNNDEENAHAFGSEMFKRLYQSGSHSMFTAVSWRGDQSRIWDNIPGIGGLTPNYWVNAKNALEVAEYLATKVNNELPGTKYIMAHSLGNMVVSSAIKDHGLVVQNYFMLDAAVASEAYDPETIPLGTPEHPILMMNLGWNGYARRLWASDWWRLFPDDDSRHWLKWENYFGPMLNAINFYSSGETALRLPDGHPHNPFSKEWAWVNQEKLKGVMLTSPIPGSPTEGGWGRNPQWAGYSPEEAENITSEALRTMPFFRPFNDPEIFNIFSGSNFLLDGHTNVRESAIYRRLMADAIPALSNPTGGNGKRANPAIRDGGFQETGIFSEIKDLTDYKRGWYRNGDWPRKYDRWKHGDLKVIAYPFNHELFDAIVRFIKTGSLEE